MDKCSNRQQFQTVLCKCRVMVLCRVPQGFLTCLAFKIRSREECISRQDKIELSIVLKLLNYKKFYYF